MIYQWKHSKLLLTHSVSSKLSNFKKFFPNLDTKAFLSDKTIFPCNYADKDHQHIVISDLRIVRNNQLRKFFTKSTKYRENNNISWQKAKSTITEGPNDCINTWCSKHGTYKSVLMEWKGKSIDRVDEKIKTMSSKTSWKFDKIVPQESNPQTLWMIFIISLLSPQ